MWLFTPRGFYSVVKNRYGDTPALMVRARSQADLESFRKLLPRKDRNTPIHDTPMADYRFRIYISRAALREALRRLGDEITYTNFKNACPKDRASVYGRVWAVMLNFFSPRYERSGWLFHDDELARDMPPDPDAAENCYCDALLGERTCDYCLAQMDASTFSLTGGD